MRRAVCLCLFGATGCQAPAPAPPCAPTLDDRAGELVLAVTAVPATSVAVPTCAGAASAVEWREVCRTLGGGGRSLPHGFAGFAVERVVAVTWPAGASLVRIEGDREEGVDVLTFVVRPVPDGRAAPNGCLVRVPRRPNQLAVVFRDGTGERTLAAFHWH